MHKNGIGKTFTHTSIPIQSCALLKQSKTLNSPNMTPSFSNPLPVQCCGGLRPGSLVDAPQHCSTSEAFSPRTVLTENICRCVQEITEHCPAIMPFLTTSTITLSCLASAVPQADSWWLGHVEPDDVVMADITGQALDIFLHGPESAHEKGILKTLTHTSIPIQLCTLLKRTKGKNPQLTKHDAFVHLSPSCPVWWWATARKLGRCSSDIFLHGPEPAQKNSIVKANIHSHIHSHPPMHTPKTNKEQNPQLTKHDEFV